jgi:mRNA capping enzyme, beta chain
MYNNNVTKDLQKLAEIFEISATDVDDIANHISSHIAAYLKTTSSVVNETVELEFRLGRVLRSKFLPGLGPRQFTTITKSMEKSSHLEPLGTVHCTSMIFNDGTRMEGSEYSKKEKLWVKDIKSKGGIDVRFAMSKEIKFISSSSDPKLSNADKRKIICKREKTRTSFRKKFWRFDITNVKQDRSVDRDSDSTDVHEVEIELEADRGMLGKLASTDYARYIFIYGLLLSADLVKMVNTNDSLRL